MTLSTQVNEYRLTNLKNWTGGKPNTQVEHNLRCGIYIRATNAPEAIAMAKKRYPDGEFECFLERTGVGYISFNVEETKKSSVAKETPVQIRQAAAEHAAEAAQQVDCLPVFVAAV